MPIPKPKEGENEQEYIGRCMSILDTEYDDISQRYAICINTYENKSEMSLIKHQYAKKNNIEGIIAAARTIGLKLASKKK